MTIHPIQAMVEAMNAAAQRDRSTTQMTLGGLIELLEGMPPETLIDGIEGPHSYRGYYCDLAFRKCADKVKAGDLLAICKGAMGKVFEGYKGGDYVMGALTPLWIASYGSCGLKLIDIADDGSLVTAEDEF